MERLNLGISQESLAHRAGLSLPALRKIERGDTAEPGVFTVLAIMRELNLPVTILADVLLDVHDSPNPARDT